MQTPLGQCVCCFYVLCYMQEESSSYSELVHHQTPKFSSSCTSTFLGSCQKLNFMPEPRRLVGMRLSFDDVVRVWGGRELRRLRWSLPPHIEITTPIIPHSSSPVHSKCANMRKNSHNFARPKNPRLRFPILYGNVQDLFINVCYNEECIVICPSIPIR